MRRLSALMFGIVLGGGLVAWEQAFRIAWPPTSFDLALVLVLGPPALLLVVGCSEAVFLGVTSRQSDDYHREWWSRIGGGVLKWTFVWVALSAISLSPLVIYQDPAFDVGSDEIGLLAHHGCCQARAGGVEEHRIAARGGKGLQQRRRRPALWRLQEKRRADSGAACGTRVPLQRRARGEEGVDRAARTVVFDCNLDSPGHRGAVHQAH